LLDWTPALDDLDRIVASSLNWERKLAASGGAWPTQP
jgi:hypothetical protein